MLECMGSPTAVMVVETSLQPRSWLDSVALDGNKSLYLVFVGVIFFSASWTAFRAVRTAASWLFC
jgi:hypothetical protein